MIQHVKDIRAELQSQPFGNLGVLVYREIPLLEAWSSQRIATQIAKVPCPGHAVGVGTRWGGLCCRCDRARNCECSEIQEISWVMRVVYDRTHDIRPVVTLPTPAVVVSRPEIVIQLEWLAILQ